MTNLPPAATGAFARLSMPVRIALLILTTLGLMFSIGVVIGIAIAFAERGELRLRGAALLSAAVLAGALFGWACWRLSAHWRQPGRSPYEKRYTKMMLLLFSAGLPIGLLVGLAGHGRPDNSLFSNGPLDPTLAAIAALGTVVILAGTLVLYHRSIDDHEQQAYLWANSLAFYFLALTMPAAWLLARGGVIGPLGFGTAMLIMLAAFCINVTVWAWLKYR